MAVTVETLDKLERRITLSLAADVLKNEVDARLKKLARTVKADGFRPGKVPMSFVASRYGSSVQYEVINDKLGEAFAKAASEAQLRVAGVPSIAHMATPLTTRRSIWPIALPTPKGPMSICRMIANSTACAGAMTSPISGTAKMAKPNPVRPRTTAAPKIIAAKTIRL